MDQSPMVSPPNHRSWLSGMKPAFRSIPVTSDCGACRNLLKRKKAKTSGRPSGPLDKKDLEREGLKQKKAGRGIQNFFTSTTPAAPVHASQPAPARAEGDDAPAGPAGPPAPAESAPHPEPAEPIPVGPGKLPPCWSSCGSGFTWHHAGQPESSPPEGDDCDRTTAVCQQLQDAKD